MGLKGTNTIKFIPFNMIPAERKKDFTYPHIVVNYRPQKEKPHCTRITVGGNQIKYPFAITTETSEMATHKQTTHE